MTLDVETFSYVGNDRPTEAETATHFLNRQVDYSAMHHWTSRGDGGSVSKRDSLALLPVANKSSVSVITTACREILYCRVEVKA
jgi:hypothetical protein